MTPRTCTPAEARAIYHEVCDTLDKIVRGHSIRHGANPVEIIMTMIEALSDWMAIATPETVNGYLAALAWVQREKAKGEVSEAAMDALRKAVEAVQQDMALRYAQARGTG